MKDKISISMQIYELSGDIAMPQAGGMKCWMLSVNLWEMKSFAFVRFRCSSFAFEASDFALRATTGQVGGQAVVNPTAGQKKGWSDLKKTLMIFLQPQRHQGTKIILKFIHSLSIRDVLIDDSHFCNDLNYISSLRVLAP